MLNPPKPHVSAALAQLRHGVTICAMIVGLCAVVQMLVCGFVHFTKVRWAPARHEVSALSFTVVAPGKLAWQADFRYRSKHYFSLTKAEASTEKGYIIGDARFSYTTLDEKWEAAVFVNNIADVRYLVQTFDLGAVLGMTEQYYGLPRWVGGTIRYNF